MYVVSVSDAFVHFPPYQVLVYKDLLHITAYRINCHNQKYRDITIVMILENQKSNVLCQTARFHTQHHFWPRTRSNVLGITVQPHLNTSVNLEQESLTHLCWLTQC